MTDEKCDKFKDLECSYPHCSCMAMKFGREPSESDIQHATIQARGKVEKEGRQQ